MNTTYCFRSSPSSADTLTTMFVGYTSYANGINDSGQIVGSGVRTAPNAEYNPLTDNIGMFGYSINSSGDVAGVWDNHASVYRSGNQFDLNDLIPPVSRVLLYASPGHQR